MKIDLAEFKKVQKRGLPKGVSRSRDRYVAYVHVNRKKVHVGMFDDPEEAGKAVQEARKKLAGQGYIQP